MGYNRGYESGLRNLVSCIYCNSVTRQVKAGMHGNSQRYKCMICNRRYIPSSTRIPLPQSTLDVDQKDIDRNQLSPIAISVLPSNGKKKASIKDVAALAGVSVPTVSNFINNKGRMSDLTRARIREAMETLHFAPSALMRAIHQRRTHILGVMMFDLNSLNVNTGTAIAPQLLTGVSAAASAAAHNILLYTGVPYQPLLPVGNEFLDGHIDGLIWVSREIKEVPLQRVISAGLPTVGVLTRDIGAGAGYVDADNLAATRQLVQHLAQLGHKRIAYAGQVHSHNLLDRRNGYRAGLAEAGIPFDPELEESSSLLRNNIDGYAASLDRWLALDNPPTAIMAQTDRIAAQFLRFLQERGIRVPEDISITGFDDAPDARWLAGGLTTIHQPLAEMGRQAVESLIKLIEGAPAEECQHVMPLELIVRASTGPVLL